MSVDSKIFGAKAKVFISSELDLKALAFQLGSKLFGVEFYFETDMDHPHAEVAMCEAIGFEVWLNHSTHIEGSNYVLRMETSHCHEAIMKERMFDLSSWLEKFLREIGSFEVTSSNTVCPVQLSKVRKNNGLAND